MKIVFRLDEFLYELFPVERNNQKMLIDFLKEYYTEGPFEPEISITDGFITIQIDSGRIKEDQKRYQTLISLCEKGRFEKAKPLAKKLIKNSPNVSEYHRILGQIYSEEGNQDEAINCLIDALRWNPENEWALLMMGNIFAKFKGDVETAMKYYDQVLVVKPDDNIALNNIGANLMQNGKTEEAIGYFKKALQINPDYPNTHYALSLVKEMEGKYEEAFVHSLKAIGTNQKKDGLYSNSFKMAIQCAKRLIRSVDGKDIVETFARDLESLCGKPIKVVIDETIPTAAKIEFAENYQREYHLVKYKSSYPAVEHLVLHELMHLELTTEARKAKENKLFVTDDSMKAKFFRRLNKTAHNLSKRGVDDESIANYLGALFDGLNRQIYNTPIDLFIEDRIFNRYISFRPFQFLSMLSMVQEGIEATTNKDIVKNSPKSILSKSKTFNLVNTLHFKNLFKVDLLLEHKPTKLELKRAKQLYKEFLDYRDDKEPGEEYDLVLNWAADLSLDSYFNLVSEDEYRQEESGTDGSLISKDEDSSSSSTSRESKMKMFLENNSDEDLNSAVTMYMAGALNYFSDMSQERIKKIAFEFAKLGMSGIDPKKDNYSIPSMKHEIFTGYRALAYYYVSWALAVPEMLSQLQLPFDNEYEMAQKLNNL